MAYAGWRGDPTLAVFSGGEQVPGASETLLRDAFSNCKRFFNLYGTTEATVWQVRGTEETERGSEGARERGRNGEIEKWRDREIER
jgi:hypothetical protein